jgi:predicted dehydrogenase
MAYKAVVVGAGGISGSWFPPLIEEGVEIAAVVDLRLEAAERRIEEYGLKTKASADLEATLADAKPEFVIDLTVPEAHCAVTCAALRAGCHVIGEKPMASSMAEARRMVRTAEETGRLYMVSQSRRWEPKHDRLRRTIVSGAIGEVTTVNCDFYMGVHFGGFREEMPSPLLLDMAIHHFDLARFLTGADPVAVYAKEFNPTGSWYSGAAAASCIFEMTTPAPSAHALGSRPPTRASGIIFTYRGSWCSYGCHTSWNGDWRIVGDKGTLIYERDQDPAGEAVAGEEGFDRPLKPIEIADSPMQKTYMHGALLEMLDFLRTGRQPQTESHDNIKSLAMVFGALESTREGRRIEVVP